MATLTPKIQQQSDSERFEANVLRVADLALEKKARDLKAYRVTGMTLTTDALVVCTASSEPHVKAIFNAVKEGMKEVGVRAVYSEGGYQDGWLLLDFGDILFHVFREQARSFYDLDDLWADAPVFDVDPGNS